MSQRLGSGLNLTLGAALVRQAQRALSLARFGLW